MDSRLDVLAGPIERAGISAIFDKKVKKMRVLKRSGTHESISFDKIATRIRRLSQDLPNVDADKLTQSVIAGLFDGVKTTDLDTLAAETAAYMSSTHPQYDMLAARIEVSNLHKQTSDSFVETMKRLFAIGLIADDIINLVTKHGTEIERHIRCERDNLFTYFGFKTLAMSYLFKIDGKIVERPQYMYMRVALGIHKEDLRSVFTVYEHLSQHYYIHATPTLFNAGTRKPQMASCFLLAMKDDSIDGIYDTLTQCARISKSAGGIGVNISNIRAAGSYIAGTNGHSNGIVPMLRNFNETARYVDQGNHI
jgi:ribonucleotide reductase alpha subunit